MHLPHIQPFEKDPLYFFTACLVGRRPVLACQQAYDRLTGIWARSASQDGWWVGRSVLMPDHVHFFASPAEDAKPRAEWHKMWKSLSSRQLCGEFKLVPPLWQTDTFDHILRNKKSYAEKWNYVRENPVRKGLVKAAIEWPWQGELNILSVD